LIAFRCQLKTFFSFIFRTYITAYCSAGILNLALKLTRNCSSFIMFPFYVMQEEVAHLAVFQELLSSGLKLQRILVFDSALLDFEAT
jgi:hypothetical protein